MTTFARLAVLALAAGLALSPRPAAAASTIFGLDVFDETGVTDAGAALGAPDGSAALVSNGGSLVIEFLHPLTGAGLNLQLLPTVGFNVIALSLGEIVGGTPVFTGEFVLVDFGSGGGLGADLTTACAGVSATGCSLLRVRNAGALAGSSGFFLDGVSGVTTAPEPSVWALMILGFAGVGWRAKSLRRAGRRTPAALRFA